MYRIINFIKEFIRETDKFLLVLCTVTSAYGLLMVYSATKPTLSDGAVFSRDFRTMLIAVGAGLVFAIVISLLDYEFIIKLWPLIGLFCVGIMIVTLIWGKAPPARPDARSWLVIGDTGFYLQPSELVKIGFIITFGFHLDAVKDTLDKLGTMFLLCVHAAIPVLLVIITGDAGSALIFILMFVGMMFMAGVKLRYFAAGAAIVAAISPLVWIYAVKDLQKNRILALFYPELYPAAIYQQDMGIKAIGSGGFWGSGLFKGTYTQSSLVPENQNDMIFSVIGEELGFVGAITAIVLITLIIARIINTGKKSRDNSTSNMCYGMAIMLAAQVIINIGMALKLFPVVGITLPFFSAGGSSNLSVYLGIGLILSIYRYNQTKQLDNLRLIGIRTPFTE